MLKLSDPFGSDLLVGLFYDAEREERGFQSRREEKKLPEALTRGLLKSEHLVRWILRNGSSWVRRLRLQEDRDLRPRPEPEEEKQIETLTPEGDHLNAVSNERTDLEFRPLTEEEKKGFLNSLNAEGKQILARLEGKSERSRTRRSRTPAPQVVDPDLVSTVPNTQATPTSGNETTYASSQFVIWNTNEGS